MRLGKSNSRSSSSSRGWHLAGEFGTHPQHIPQNAVIGQVSVDLVRSVWLPKMEVIALSQMERYATELLEYEDAAVHNNNATLGADDESGDQFVPPMNNPSDTATDDMSATQLRATPPIAPLFHSKVVWDEFLQVASETSDQFFSQSAPVWKTHANAARFERLLDEKYGVFRPFITEHPQVEQFIRAVQRKYALGHFSVLRQTDPPIPRSTVIVILFMMSRGGMRWEVMVLSTAFFLFGVQPWALVALVSLGHGLLMRRKYQPPKGMKYRIPAVEPYYSSAALAKQLKQQQTKNRSSFPELITAQQKYDLLLQPVGSPLRPPEAQRENKHNSNHSCIDTSLYDTILLGSGPATLFTGALLSRAGRKVVVLSNGSDASGCLTLEACSNPLYKQIPFDVDNTSLSNISKQQPFLATALSTTTDYQGGIRFAQIGSDADGHAFEILSIPGVGGDRKSSGHDVPFVLRADGGARTLMEDAALYLGDGWPDPDGIGVGNSTVGAYIQACESMKATSGLFYLSKILSDSVNNLRKSSIYEECAIRNASAFLDKCFPLNAHTRSLMAGIGMRVENIKPLHTSMATHASSVCAATNGEGLHYPIGGPRALSRAFATVIEQNGGRIVTDVSVKDLLFDNREEKNEKSRVDKGRSTPPRCVGVQLHNGCSIRFDLDRYSQMRGISDPAVVSMLGFIDTFIRFLPEDIRDEYKVPKGLPALSERRPVFKLLFLISGTAEELNITGADYFRLPNASIANDVFDVASGTVACGIIGGADDGGEETPTEEEDIVKSTNKDLNGMDTTSVAATQKRKNRSQRGKYHVGESWMQVSFPSAKDPSFSLRHGNITACVVTIEADNDFVTPFSTNPKIFVTNKPTAATQQEKQRLLDKVKKDLLQVYPQLENKIEHGEVRGPFRRGLSHEPHRFAAKGVRVDTPYSCLYVGGSDLTVGESFITAAVGGWLVANALVGYHAIDHLLIKKNLSTDLDYFLEQPLIQENEDLAVPFPVQTQIGAELSVES